MRKFLSYLIVTLLILTIAGIAVWAYSASRKADRDIVCKKLNIKIRDSKDMVFVSCGDIASALNAEFGDFRGKRLDGIDLEKVERFVDNRSAVLKSEVYTTPDSCLNIDIRQRLPMLRLIGDGTGCYCDCNGKLFPLQGKTSARVLTIDGDFPLDLRRNGRPSSPAQAEWLDKMLGFAEFVREHKWDGRISSVRTDSRGELTIYMSDTPESFLFGTPDDIESKFGRIGKWYTALAPAVADKGYKSVNVKFDGQIVCR